MTDPQVIELARAVAALLGDGWSVRAKDPDDAWAAYLDHPERGSIFVRRHWRDGRRVYIAGSAAPQHPKQTDLLHDLELGDITVAIDRGAEAVAKEITRRLLPTYEPALADFRRRVAEATAAESARDAVLGRVASTLGETPRGGAVHWSSAQSPSDARATFRPLYGGTPVNVELTVSDELAAEIAKLLSTRAAADRDGAQPFSDELLPAPALADCEESPRCGCGERLVYEERHYATRSVAIVGGTLFALDDEQCNAEAYEGRCLRCRTCGTGYEMPGQFDYGQPADEWQRTGPGRWTYYRRGADSTGAGWQIDVSPTEDGEWSWLISSWGEHSLGADVADGRAASLGAAQGDALEAARELFGET